MAGEKEARTQVSEAQIMQMAQQEERELMRKNSIMESVGALLREAVFAKETLEEMKNSSGKMLVSVGGTVLIEVSAANTKTCKRGFAENGYKEEKIEQTIAWLGKKEAQLKAQLEKLQKEVSVSSARLGDLVGILKQIDNEKRKSFAKRPPMLSK